MNKTEFFDSYKRIFAENNLDAYAGDEVCEKMYALCEEMLRVNSFMNLTAITEPEDIILKHLADSLTVAKFIPEGARVSDIGCGAGFPSLPLAIARPDIKITAVDSTAKRIDYVNATARLLGLDNLTAVSMRAEDGARMPEYREKFDICTARAVANLPILVELCLGYVRVGGSFVAMKAKSADEELLLSLGAINKLGGDKNVDTCRVFLKNRDLSEERALVEIKKTSPTPAAYPRNYSQIKKKPLA